MPKLLTNLAILAGLAVLLVVGLVYLSSRQESDPCSPDRFLGKCYRMEKDICLRQREPLVADCKRQVEALDLPPARLTGPILDRCEQVKFDRAFRFLRRQSAECDAIHKEVDAWHMTNPDF